MRWLKRDTRKAGIAITGMLLLLVLMIWVPESAAGAYERVSGPAGPSTITVQATQTVDATVTALNKEEVAQQQHTWENWLWGNAATILSSFLSTLVIVIGVLFGFWQWRLSRRDAQDKELKDRQSERERRAEERFQSAVTGLGDEKEGARIGAAILLRTFLRPGYEQFYVQTFDLAVANLRLSRTPTPPGDPKTLQLLTTLRQALIVVFKEAFPLARDIGSDNKKAKEAIQSLDATDIQLDNAYLVEADLKQVWMPHALLRKIDLSWANLSKANLSWTDISKANLSKANLDGAYLIEANLSKANLSGAKLNEANLIGADLSGASLVGVDLSRADLSRANLSGADLIEANLIEADLIWANLKGVNLSRADLSGAKLIWANLGGARLSGADLGGAKLIGADFSGADLSGAKLIGDDLSRIKFVVVERGGADFREADSNDVEHSGANLSGTDLSGADLSGADLSGANLKDALFLKDTNLHGVHGLTREQLETCKVKGAIIDEGPMTVSPQLIASSPPPVQSNDLKAQAIPPAQGSRPIPDTGGSRTISSQQDTAS